MTTISRREAFDAVAMAVENDQYQAAQRLLNLVSDAILEGRKFSRVLTEIVLKDARDEQLYASIMSGCGSNDRD